MPNRSWTKRGRYISLSIVSLLVILSSIYCAVAVKMWRPGFHVPAARVRVVPDVSQQSNESTSILAEIESQSHAEVAPPPADRSFGRRHGDDDLILRGIRAARLTTGELLQESVAPPFGDLESTE